MKLNWPFVTIETKHVVAGRTDIICRSIKHLLQQLEDVDLSNHSLFMTIVRKDGNITIEQDFVMGSSTELSSPKL